MTTPISIPGFKMIRTTPGISRPNRLVPESKHFALPVLWQERGGQPVPVLVQLTPPAGGR